MLGGLPDDPATIGWLQSAGPDETAPVILGYQQLCLALSQPQPEADAILLARLSLSAPTLRLATCRFAEWWFHGPRPAHQAIGPHLAAYPPPPASHDRP